MEVHMRHTARYGSQFGSWRTALLFGAIALAIASALAGNSRAEMPAYKLSLLPEDESVYAPPSPPREEQGINLGGVNLDLKITYLTDYIYRGVDHSSFPNRSKNLNFQFDTTISFNTGKLPHPFIGVFANIFRDDPVSRFQEIRPFAGLEWNLRPLTFATGINAYIYPEREKVNTSEVWARVTLDDSLLFRSEQPLLSPYLYGAYDYDLNDGWYFEAGVKHDFVIEDTGITLTLLGDVAYVDHVHQQFIFLSPKARGLQHYDIGLIGRYSLNQFFRFSRRYGDVTLNGYLYYTDGIEKNILHTDSKLWGGVGIQFKY